MQQKVEQLLVESFHLEQKFILKDMEIELLKILAAAFMESMTPSEKVMRR